ncbi:hypothetical protein [Nonomuraea basaltis]|uniref:hypothetical protein n=1 Tax=Nonomuraea basaltis TaxID=2495887 RepID=UPI00110C543E|nr:hypothetical protein [Nonomuraea basaltis]TMR89275.1 hypothetical protein EJK15_61580 [Nonomuraea basaltis]
MTWSVLPASRPSAQAAFTLVRAGPMVDAPFVAAAASPLADAVGAVLAVATGERFAELADVAASAPWEVACAVTGGRLLAPPPVGFRINMNHTLVAFSR